MRILIATALFPPDTADVATYTKEAATRLKEHHDVTVLTYGFMPEEIPGVRIIAVPRSLPRILRTARYTLLLRKLLADTDVLYVQNAPAVELPVVLATVLKNTRIITHIADKPAHKRTKESFLRRPILNRVKDMSEKVLKDTPPLPPEILPFQDRPTEALQTYETKWKEHIELLHDLYDE